MEKVDVLFNLISLSQNSILTWLAVGLGALIGIIELTSSGFSRRTNIIIFESLILLSIFSFGMVVSHMSDVYHYREDLYEIDEVKEYKEPPSSKDILPKIMEGILDTLIYSHPIARFVVIVLLILIPNYLYFILG